MREKDLIRWIRSQTRLDAEKVPVGPGDDCAVMRVGGEALIVTTDQVLDGVHFILSRDGAEAAGRKAMNRNLSDVAAMACRPAAAVATVALPKGFAREPAEAIYRGLRSAGDAFDCPVIGGDVASWDGALAISATVLARPGPAGAILRSGARVGDALCVTGALGGAWRTDRHLTFTPRIAEALALAERCELRAMIDLSDGLATDVGHLCEASNVGAEIDAAAVPIHDAVRSLPGAGALQAAMCDGEDYELLFAVSADDADALIADPPEGLAVTRIGAVVDAPGATLIRPDGTREPLGDGGWEHRT